MNPCITIEFFRDAADTPQGNGWPSKALKNRFQAQVDVRSECLGRPEGVLRAFWGRFRGISGASRGRLGGRLGDILGASWGRLGGVLGASRGSWWRFGGVLAASCEPVHNHAWSQLTRSLQIQSECLGRLEGVLGAFGGRRGVVSGEN